MADGASAPRPRKRARADAEAAASGLPAAIKLRNEALGALRQAAGRRELAIGAVLADEAAADLADYRRAIEAHLKIEARLRGRCAVLREHPPVAGPAGAIEAGSRQVEAEAGVPRRSDWARRYWEGLAAIPRTRPPSARATSAEQPPAPALGADADLDCRRPIGPAAPVVIAKPDSRPAAFCVSRSRPHPDLRDEADPPGLCRAATGPPNRHWPGSDSPEEPASYSPELARGPVSRSPVPQPPPRPTIIASFHNPSARRPRMIAAGPRCGDAHRNQRRSIRLDWARVGG